MKKGLIINTILFILLIFCTNISVAQKVEEKSGNRPIWLNWLKGKDFKYRTNKSKNLGLEKGPKYLFIGEAREPAYWREGYDEYGFTALETVEEAEDDARETVAFLLNTYVESAATKDFKMDGLKRKRVIDRSKVLATKASFGGFVKVASYYQKESEKIERSEREKVGSKKLKYYHAWVLCSYNREKLKDILRQYIDALKVENLDKEKLLNDTMSEIDSEAENIDDLEFN